MSSQSRILLTHHTRSPRITITAGITTHDFETIDSRRCPGRRRNSLFGMVDYTRHIGITRNCCMLMRLCAIVQHLTHDFTCLVGLLKSCNGMSKLNICRITATYSSSSQHVFDLQPRKHRWALQTCGLCPFWSLSFPFLSSTVTFDWLRMEKTGLWS